jgi:hypothetical protein
VDVTPLLRAQYRCRDAARVGITLAGLTLLLVFAAWWWILVPVALWAAAVGTERCSRLAAVAHFLACAAVVAGASISLADTRRMLERHVKLAPQPWWMIAVMVALLAFMAALLLGGVHGAFAFQKGYPKRANTLPLGLRQSLRTFLASRSRRLPAVLGASAAAALCIAPAVTPAALMLGGLLTGQPFLADRALDAVGLSWWTMSAYIIVVVVGAWGLGHFLTKAKRLGTLASQEARWADPRRPILLLRSFADDLTPLHRDIEPGARHQLSWVYPKLWTLEETIEKALGEWGPVIAIGRPGESLPPSGAAREYLAHSDWQGRVGDLIDEAQMIVAILGSTPGVAYEYQLLAEKDVPAKLIVVLPPAADLTSRWRIFTAALNTEPELVSPVELPNALVARFSDRFAPVVLTCRERTADSYRIALQCALSA